MSARPPAIPGFRVLRSLGQGGMGAVFLVEPDGLPGVRRALKVVPVRDPARRERFVREAALLARVDAVPGIVRVHGAGEHEGQAWLCMAFVEGEDLARRLRRTGPLPWREAVRLVRELGLGLAAVHEHGVVHRDIKPANVLVDDTGAPRLIDFGVASAADLERLTLTGVLVGTPAYFSPEQAGGRRVGDRSDVYALGVLLFELLTGERPFDDDVPLATLVGAILLEAPAPPSARQPDVPPAVDAVVLAALSKHPAARPDARGLVALLDQALERPERPVGRRRSRAGRLLLGGAVLAPGLLLVALALRLEPAVPAPAPAPAPARSPAPSAPFGSFEPIVQQVRAGRALTALGAINQHLEVRSDDDRAAAHAAEGAVRAHMHALVGARSAEDEELRATLRVMGRLRELSGVAPSPDPLADAVLEKVRESMTTMTLLNDGDAAPVVALVEAVVSAALLPRDVVAADAAFEAAKETYFGGGCSAREYQRLLVSMVRLDLDVHDEHVMRVGPLPSDLQGGAATAYLDLRIRAVVGGDRRSREAERQEARLAALTENAAAMLALVEGPRGVELGPVTRARALTEGVAAARSLGDAAGLLDRAAGLDPRSPFPLVRKAVLLHGVATAPEWSRQTQTDQSAADLRQDALAAATEAAARLRRDRYAGRASLRRWQGAALYRSIFEIFVAEGELDQAREVVEQMAALYPGQDDVQKLRTTVAEAEARARGSRVSDF